MILETALRRPRALRDAVTLALTHKHFCEYMRETSHRLDGLIGDLRTLPDARVAVAAATGPSTS